MSASFKTQLHDIFLIIGSCVRIPIAPNDSFVSLFVERKLMLSSSFRCDKIHAMSVSHFIVLLKSDLDVQPPPPLEP